MRGFLERPVCWLAVALPLSTACPWCIPEDLNALKPEAVVEPNPIAFGTRMVNADDILPVTLKNAGTAPMNVTDVAIEPADAPFSLVETEGQPLVQHFPEGKAVAFKVVFHPPVRGPHQATLVVETTDSDRPRLEVPLSGTGGQPRILVAPEEVDFGFVNQGAGLSRSIIVQNPGLDTLHVSGVHVVPPTGAGFQLPAENNFLKGDIPVGESVSIGVLLDPPVSGEVRGVLHILSDAEDDPDHPVLLAAHANLAPVALLVEKTSRQSSVTTDLYVDLVLDSTGTADPEQDPITRLWSVVERPLGSQSILEETMNPVEREIYIDTVGTYRVELTARDDHGASSTAEVTIRAIRDLALRLTWRPAPDAPCHSAVDAGYQCGKTDVDLHLVAPGGTLGDYYSGCESQPGCDPRCKGDAGVVCRSHGTDCAFANRNPDWGDAGIREDDPRQDIDDVMGWGPENISLNNPVAGDYTIQVHFCSDRLSNEGAVAQVEVFFHGDAADPPVLGPATLTHEGSLWVAGVVRYHPSATPKFSLLPMPTTAVEGPPDLCK